MSDARQLIRIIQTAGRTPDNYLSDVVVGVVTHISPLVVKVDKLQLTHSFVILPGHVTVNAVGDRLRMLRCGKGQKYYVLENMDFTSGAYDSVIAQMQQDLEDMESGKVPYSAYTATDVLNKIKTVDGIDSGLDADLLDGKHASDFATSEQGTKADNALPASSYTASDMLTKLKTVDGVDSGLDADLLDGKHASEFATSVHIGSGGTSHANASTSVAGFMSSADKTRLDGILSLVYPVGSLYWNKTLVNPATLFGGTWTRVQDKFIIAAGSTYAAGSTGGSATVQISQTNLPAVSYEVNAAGTMGGTNHKIYGDYGGSGSIAIGHITKEGGYATAANPATVGPLGSGTALNNMPPYVAYYCWERTS